MRKKIKGLIIFANPKGTYPLKLAEEKKRIREALKLARNKKGIKITFVENSTIHDLRQLLLKEKFNVVHVSSHGSSNSLILEDKDGISHELSPKPFAELLQKYESLECLILNACHSKWQALLTSLDIPLTIAMDGELSDDAAVEFSRGFYEALAIGNDFDFAYLEGCDTARNCFPNAKFQPKILRGDKQLREADFKVKKTTSKTKTFTNILFARKNHLRVSIRDLELGSLSIFKDRLEFANENLNLSITNIDGIDRALMGGDNNNNWVKVVYRVGTSKHTAYFADPSTSEAVNSPSGGDELFEALSKRFKVISSIKSHEGLAEPGEIPGNFSDINAQKDPAAIDSFNLPPLTNFFTGRVQVLKKLHSTLNEHKLASLHGMFGLGKTSVAVKYAYDHQEDYSDVIFIRATDAELLQQMADKAESFDEKRVKALKTLDDKSEFFREYLDSPANWSQQGKKYLLLFDNVDSVEQIKKYVPSNKQGHIIFTANDINITGLGNEVEISEIESYDGTLLLFRRATSQPKVVYNKIPAKDHPALDEIVLELGRSPLAINTAGAYIYSTKSSWENYLKLIKTNSSAVLDETDKSDPYHNGTVLRAFEISYFATCKPDRNTKESKLIAESAMHMIHGSVFISPYDIPEEFLQTYVSKQGDDFRKVVDDIYLWSKAREKALQFDLLRYDQKRNVYWSHRLIQMIIEKLLDE